ncbi:hypothetical protein [uncultured Duncaniella sp.]|uniref:hypothetical protein n=1 Tax=uncultured Duncaniella sp. TaxID=2768039 RepID=UPI0026366579|nr:hypothetical protein [uncultured Duncaniella sp.]
MYNQSKITKGTLLWGVLLILGLTLGACSTGYNEDISSDRQQTNMVVRFTLPESASASAKSKAGDGYEDGSVIENYIDVQNSCKVLFFSQNNTFLGLLDRQVVAEIDKRQYNVCGIPPLNLPSDFKIMIAANWPDMSVIDNAVAGATTIDDICHAAASVFDMLPGLMLDLEKGHLMPFFGIRSYSGIPILPGTTTLPEPITLLRAMAKVEVIFDVDDRDSELTPAVTLCHFNGKGYCAPYRVYDQNDYGQGNDWDSDYLHRLHLVTDDNNNDKEASGRRAELAMSADGSYRWTAYIPEYRNLKADGSPAPDEAYIEIKLASQAPDEKPFRIYFSLYSGETSANTTLPRFNIERNNIYRFNVSLHHGQLSIIARPWNYRPQPEINA